MKSVKWETSPGALAAFLASKPQAAAQYDLYTFNVTGSINGGQPLTYTTADVDVTVPYASPITYTSKDVQFDQINNKASCHWKVGVDVDTWQVLTAPRLPNAATGYTGSTLGGIFWLSAIRAGALDGATVQVDRAYFDTRTGIPQGGNAISPLGVINIFTGRIAEIDLGRTNAVISINSHLELLNINMPRNLFQAGCRWTLFDSGCTLNASSFAQNGSASADTTTNTLLSAIGAPGGSGTYALGRIVMTSGQNAGFSRGVRSWTPGTFTLIAPFPYPIQVGNTFTAYPGCNKSYGSCSSFGNTTNFGGTPFTPVPEAAV